jgi:deoxyribonuclease V
MKINDLHRWDVTYHEAVAIQQTLREKLILPTEETTDAYPIIAGADISYAKNDDLFFAVVVLLTYPGLEIIEEKQAIAKAPFPYIPGLLTFREGPALLEAFAGLEQKPDLVIFDGQGIAHPRGIGLASHLGLFLDIPTIGCGKKRLVGHHQDVGESRGDQVPLLFDERMVGMVLRTKDRVNPVFISPGHRIGLQRAVEVVLACCRGYRLPEPVRKAHIAVNQLRLSGRGSF